jgi:hypothetical protein
VDQQIAPKIIGGSANLLQNAKHTNWLPMDKWMSKKLMEKRAMPEPKKEIKNGFKPHQRRWPESSAAMLLALVASKHVNCYVLGSH